MILNFGLNLNKTNYSLKDNYNQGEDDFSGDYGFDPIVSPKIELFSCHGRQC